MSRPVPSSMPERRIALLSLHTCPCAKLGGKTTGGMNVYVQGLVHELDRRGIAADVFTYRPAANTCAESDGAGPAHVLGRSNVFHVGPMDGPSVQDEAADDVVSAFVEGVLENVRQRGVHYEVLHSHYWLSGLAAMRLRTALGGVPFVHMFHTLGQLKSRIARDESERATPGRLRGEAEVVSHADRLIAATVAEHDDLTLLYGAPAPRVSIIPPGIDLDAFQPPTNPAAEDGRRKRRVLFVGRIQPLKGIDTLLHAAAHLRAMRPRLFADLEVVVVGGRPETPDPELTRLLALHEQLGLGETVRFLPAMDRSLLAAQYARADVVAMPSLYESFGMVALEAMSMGVPVIASRVGGLRHLVQDGVTGLLFEPEDAVGLSAALERLLTDEPARQALGAQARQAASRFAWARVADRILDLYREVRS